MKECRPKIPETQILSKSVLQADAAQIRRRHHRWRQSHRPEDLYSYLLSVYRLFRRWQKVDGADRAARRLLKLAGISASRRCHPMRTIIDATSGADRKTKSRWARALRYAWRERRRYHGLKQCLKTIGGVAGAAQKWADTHSAMQTPPGFVRVGGESRVPKIPFFVHVDLVDEYRNW